MLDTLTTAQAGAGIKPKNVEQDTVTREELLKHENHYVFSPGETLALGDRQLSLLEVPQGRLALVQDHLYLDKNRSSDYIKGEDKNEFILYTKTAQDSVREIVGAFLNGEIQKSYEIKSLTGVDANRAITVETLLMPELPPTLKKMIYYLMTESQKNISSSELGEDVKQLAESVRQEMLNASRRVFTLQSSYLNRTERELINSRKPNGRGKSNLDDLDKHYYRMCERKMPLESDLDFTAASEAESTSDSQSEIGGLADAFTKAIERLAPKQEDKSEEIESLKSQLQETQARFDKLLDMLETGEVTSPKKAKSAK